MNAFDKIKFCIEQNCFETSLSSFAISDFLKTKGYNPEVILLYPVSLIFNSTLIKKKEFQTKCCSEFYESLVKVLEKPDDYLKNPVMFFKKHPHSKEVEECKVIHSLGEYDIYNIPDIPDKHIPFDCSYSDIVLMIMTDMIKRCLTKGEEIKRVIVDISSGHNIYVFALIEALKYLNVWLKLYNCNKDAPTNEIAFSDPIISGGKQTEYKIYFEKQSVKAFFTSPIKNEDITNFKLAKAIFSDIDQREKKQKIQKKLEKFLLLFSAIKNNAPLAVYHLLDHEVKDILQILEELINHIEKKLTEKYNTSPKLNKDDYTNAILALGFYIGIRKLLQEVCISNEADGINIKNIRENFQKIYNVFGLNLNDTVLGNEVDKIEKGIKPTTEWTNLIDLLYAGDKSISTPQKRNFFAHAGFEGCVTECKMKNDHIYVRYKETYIDTINSWLKESV